MTDKQISEILEEEGYSFTDNLEESVFILKKWKFGRWWLFWWKYKNHRT